MLVQSLTSIRGVGGTGQLPSILDRGSLGGAPSTPRGVAAGLAPHSRVRTPHGGLTLGRSLPSVNRPSMHTHERRRLPISTRHAFALAFDLAVRRDAVHSLLVPFLLRAPWSLALVLLPPADEGAATGQVLALTSLALLGDFVTLLVVSAMLRLRARSVFNTPPGVRPAPAGECYAQGLRRVPWLFVTEALRNLSIIFGTFLFVVPAVFLGYRLSFATEAVVLNEPNTSEAFRRSFRLSEGRFERWVEMIVVSGALGLAAVFAGAALCVVAGRTNLNTVLWVAQLLTAAITPIIQYAWTFFYLRLVEGDVESPGVEVEPAYAWAAGSSDPHGDSWRPAAGESEPLVLVESGTKPEQGGEGPAS